MCKAAGNVLSAYRKYINFYATLCCENVVVGVYFQPEGKSATCGELDAVHFGGREARACAVSRADCVRRNRATAFGALASSIVGPSLS